MQLTQLHSYQPMNPLTDPCGRSHADDDSVVAAGAVDVGDLNDLVGGLGAFMHTLRGDGGEDYCGEGGEQSEEEGGCGPALHDLGGGEQPSEHGVRRPQPPPALLGRRHRWADWAPMKA